MPNKVQDGIFVLEAWLLLFFVHLALRFVAFQRITGWIGKLPGSRSPDPTPDAPRRILQAVRTAAKFVYRSQQDCLPRALTTLLLLRSVGTHGDLCLGVRRCPFEGHAWVEVEGQVLDDRPERVSAYTVVHRSTMVS